MHAITFSCAMKRKHILFFIGLHNIFNLGNTLEYCILLTAELIRNY